MNLQSVPFNPALAKASTRQPERHRPLLLWNLANSATERSAGLAQLGMTLSRFSEPAALNAALREKPGAVVLILFPEQLSEPSLSLLEQMISEHHECAWIALLTESLVQKPRIFDLITRSFYDYHHLPIEHQRLGIIIGHAFGMLALRKQVSDLSHSSCEISLLLGNSQEVERIRQQITRIADTPNTVLIYGESGTGKELVAQAIHQLSSRHDQPFEALNCAALPSSLIQAELFGHEKGAYTDAHQRKIGRFESCHHGTLFLDEIGDMPQEQQVNLLRVLEQGCIRRIGGNEDIPVDVRIVAATHIDLDRAVAEGRFRKDLFYRLNVLKIELPPLRERNGDTEFLARYFFQRFRVVGQPGPNGFSSEAISAIRSYHWPGNIRELMNRVQHAIVLAEGSLIRPEDLGIERRDSKRIPITLESARKQAEVDAIKNALHHQQHNISEAARELGISRATLYRLIDKHDITTPH